MLAGHKVLLVDDESSVLDVVGHWLTESGFQVRCAADGKEAITAIETECPQIMIVDWKMPNMDGIELCTRVRQREFANEIYILFLTARTEVDALVQAFSAGADDFLSKPVLKEELLTRVRLAARRLANAATL